MTIYKGVLQHMAGGQEYGKALKFVRREFIDIGGQHIRGVQIKPYQDELLLSLMGEEITLSGIGGKKGFTVVGVKTPDGEVSKTGLIELIFETIFGTIGGVILGFMIFIVALIVGGIFWDLFWPVGLLIILIGLAPLAIFTIAPTIGFFKTIKVLTEL